MKKLFLLLALFGVVFTACEAGDGLDEGGNNSNIDYYDPNNPLSNKKCSNNEILYISKSCLPMELNTYDGWGAKLTSNIYENGVGRLTFNGKVTTIPEKAFYENGLLEYIKFPNSVTSIGVLAFYGCNNLASITILDGVTLIGNNAFSDCSNLSRVDISDLSAWCRINFGIEGANPLSNGARLYISNSEVVELIIPSDITEIKGYTFSGCTSITKVTIHNCVTSIGALAFSDCSNMINITIPDSVISVGYGAFEGCASLPIIENIRYADTYIVGVVDSTNTTYSIAENTRFIGDYAFYYCRSLIDVTIPDTVISIGSSAFEGCFRLASVTIPDSVTSIGAWAFRECKSLENIKISESITSIGIEAFYYCNVTSITIPYSVTSIGHGAFASCGNLTSIYCKPTTPPTGNSSMFSNNASSRKIYVPRNSAEAYKSASGWSDFKWAIEGYDF